MTKLPGESEIDFACRKVAAMSKWHNDRDAEISWIYAEARGISLYQNDDEAARDHVISGMEALYSRYPLVAQHAMQGSN